VARAVLKGETTMPEAREFRCYEYVNRPFANVKETLVNDMGGLLQRATSSAVDRAGSVIAKLRVSAFGLEIGKEVKIDIGKIDEHVHPPHAITEEGLSVELRWKATANASLFPALRAELIAYALSADETQLDLHCWYEPPGGVFGTAGDVLIGRRVAEASIHRFLEDITEQLRKEIA